MRLITGFQEIIEMYDVFLLDQWGVIHDGENLLPGAQDMFEKLHAHNKDVVLISNSGKRSTDSHGRLKSLNIPRSHYVDVITSGETVWQAFTEMKDPFYQTLGSNYYIYTWPEDGDRAIVEGLGLTEVEGLEQADFILFAGVDRPSLKAYEDDLKKACDLGLPMICANPDLVSLTPDGRKQLCPGTMAHAFEDMGGTVRWHGKPQAEIYQACLKQISFADQKKILCVGDSLQHDIAGANNAGMDSAFILSGIHGDAIEMTNPMKDIEKLCLSYNQTPTWSVENFDW